MMATEINTSDKSIQDDTLEEIQKVTEDIDLHEVRSEQDNTSITTAHKCNTICGVCGYEAIKPTKKREKATDVLPCNDCKQLIHFHCTQLPPYMLHVLSTSSKKYICEKCARTPTDFLQNLIINSSIVNNHITPDNTVKVGTESIFPEQLQTNVYI